MLYTKLPFGAFNNFSAPQSGRIVLRASNGNLYVVVTYSLGSITNRLAVLKSTDNGKTWVWPDYTDSTKGISGTNPATTAAIDGNDVIHIAYAATNGVGYIKYFTSTDTFDTHLEFIPGASSSFQSIAIDSNNIPHIVTTSGGSTFVKYSNRVLGSWIPPVTISAVNATRPDITLDRNNIPWISYISTTASSVVVAVGNTNNASSFTATTMSTSISNNGSTSIAVDSNNNVWASYTGLTGRIQLVGHLSTAAAGTFQNPIDNGKDGICVSLATDGLDIYVFYTRTYGGIAYDRYNSAQNSWLGEQIIQPIVPGSTINQLFAKWSTFFNNGATGANNQSQNKIDYVFGDTSNFLYYSSLDTGQISTGLFSISFSPAGTTTSTSSSTSSTSSSTSLSSTSSSTSISTSSTSSSTSISTSSTSSSISTSSTSASTSISTSVSTSSTSSSVSSSISTSSTSSSISTSSTSSSISVSTSTSISSTSSSISTSTSISSTSSSTSVSTSSTSSSTSISSTSSSTSHSTSTSVSSTSFSTTQSVTTSTSSTSSSTSVSSTSSSISTSISTSSTSSSVSTSSTSSSVSTSLSTSSTSASTSLSTSSISSSVSTSLSTSSTSSSTSISVSSSTSSTSTSTTTQFTTSTSTTTTLPLDTLKPLMKKPGDTLPTMRQLAQDGDVSGGSTALMDDSVVTMDSSSTTMGNQITIRPFIRLR